MSSVLVSPSAGHGNEVTHRLIQQRLSRFWTLPEQPRPKGFPFMDLSQDIRRMIYLQLGVPVGEFLSLNFVPWSAVRAVHWTISHRQELSAPEGDDLTASFYENGEEEPNDGSEEATDVLNLLLVSKAIYNDIRSIIFSENDIGVSQTRFGGLGALVDSGLHVWQALRVLVIRMQPCGCLTPYCTVEGWPARDPEEDDYEDEVRFLGLEGDPDQRHRRCLSSVNRHDQNTLRQWERICTEIARHGQPNRLRLFLACNVDDVDMAERIVKPLYSLPRLQDIAISFGLSTKNAISLRQLAKETVLDLLGKLHATKPFRFLDLPVELQIKILEYTALRSTSSVRVQLDGTRWFSSFPFWTSCAAPIEGRETQSESHDTGKAGFPFALKSRSVFCSREYVAFSSTCECSTVPLSWFCVSHQFGDVAKTVFYSHTEFEVIGWKEILVSPMYPSADADTDRCAPKAFRDFLRCHGRDVIHQMRKLTLTFPPMDPTYLTSKRKSWALWLETIELLATAANLPGLELSVCFASHIYPPEQDGNDWQRFKMAKGAEEAEMRAAYGHIIAPMKRLSKLKRLFIHIAWPFRDGLVDVRRSDEQMLEQTVMGESYDSRKFQKPLDTFWSQPGFIDWWI
jgi:hypothetical protein